MLGDWIQAVYQRRETTSSYSYDTRYS